MAQRYSFLFCSANNLTNQCKGWVLKENNSIQHPVNLSINKRICSRYSSQATDLFSRPQAPLKPTSTYSWRKLQLGIF